ncbi:MAG TPA: hypothetical protein VN494_01565 [Patescibacteria group bacterium]|nr:hypothetical protein [Patescibacteria group bacterium]
MHRESKWSRVCVLVLGITMIIALPTAGWAHGVVGKRWFPSTLAVEDPFVSDELSTVVEHIRDPHALETEIEMELTKRLTPNLAIGIGGTRSIIRPRGGHGEEGEEHEHGEATGTSHGWQNPEFMLRYQFIRDPKRELAATAAINVSPGGVGNRSVGRLSGTTVSPALQIGKGFGDLPDWADWLKPVAVTTSVGFDLRTNRNNREEDAQHAFAWGVTMMYSVPYLQSFVKDVGLPWPFNRLFPIVEFNGETLMSGPEKGNHTAFANPGLIWAGRYMQLGVEAKIPLNNTSGSSVGILGMVHFFLDDIAPDIFTWTPFHGVLGPQTLPR